MRLTTCTLRNTISELTDESRRAFAGLAVYLNDSGYQMKLVPVIEGRWFFADECLLYTRYPTVKTLPSARAILNFACRYGIDARRVRFMEGCL